MQTYFESQDTSIDYSKMTIYRFCPNLLQFHFKKIVQNIFIWVLTRSAPIEKLSMNTKLLLGFPIKIIDFFFIFRSLKSNELF